MTNATHKYIRIKDRLKDLIAQGLLVEKLPGERVLAERLGVSYMTVRKAVSELVDEGILYKDSTKGTFVGHKKNGSHVTGNIGFFLDDSIQEGISSPYYSLVFKSLEAEATKNGYNILLFSDFDDLNPLKNTKKVDGAIISCFPRIEDRIQTIKQFLPLVLLDNIAADKSLPSVTIDNFNSCSHSTEYLLSLGHRRLGFVSGLMDSDVCKHRLLGFRNALTRAGLKADPKLVFRGDYSFESGERAGDYFAELPQPPTAIVCANDSMAIGVMKVIQERGFRIPEDISVLGFDDVLLASVVFPPLTTNAAPIEAMAAKAVETLLAEINGANTDFTHVVLEASLIKRGTCAPPAPPAPAQH